MEEGIQSSQSSMVLWLNGFSRCFEVGCENWQMASSLLTEDRETAEAEDWLSKSESNRDVKTNQV